MALTALQHSSPSQNSRECSDMSEGEEEGLSSQIRLVYLLLQQISEITSLSSPLKETLSVCFRSWRSHIKGTWGELRKGQFSFNQRINEVAMVINTHGSAIQQLRKIVEQQQDLIADLWRQQDDLKDRHRRNNIRPRSIPEATTVANIRPTVLVICNMLMWNPPTDPIELDRVYCTPPVRSPTMQHPRDVLFIFSRNIPLCRFVALHFGLPEGLTPPYKSSARC